MGDSVKRLAKINNILCCLLIHQTSHLILEAVLTSASHVSMLHMFGNGFQEVLLHLPKDQVSLTDLSLLCPPLCHY